MYIDACSWRVELLFRQILHNHVCVFFQEEFQDLLRRLNEKMQEVNLIKMI